MGIKRACKLDAEGKKKHKGRKTSESCQKKPDSESGRNKDGKKEKKEKEKPSRIGWKGSQMFLVPVVGC